MSDIVTQLGLDHETLKWYQLAACKNADINWFYDKYETDKELALQVDQMCMHCPVAKYCLEEAVENKEKGVWGGVYLDLGRVDRLNNSHKTPEVWKELKKIHGRTLIH
jgi:hypothetical protein